MPSGEGGEQVDHAHSMWQGTAFIIAADSVISFSDQFDLDFFLSSIFSKITYSFFYTVPLRHCYP